jgi:hypothetical protein
MQAFAEEIPVGIRREIRPGQPTYQACRGGAKACDALGIVTFPQLAPGSRLGSSLGRGLSVQAAHGLARDVETVRTGSWTENR